MTSHFALLWNRGLERFGNGPFIDPFSSSIGMDRNSYFHGADFCVLGHCTHLWGATGISFLCIVPVIWYTTVLNICTLWESSSEFSSLCRWVCFTSLIILNSQWPLRGKNERPGIKIIIPGSLVLHGWAHISCLALWDCPEKRQL